jgi:tRNA (cmo5U34)-methyltransferase
VPKEWVREDWTDEQTVRDWDADPTGHNPVRAEQLDILLSVLQSEYRTGKTILDIGMGSGIVEEMIFQRMPGAQIVGIDASEPMVRLANQRLAPYKDQYEVMMHDITNIGGVRLPERDYQIVISIQTIHNVEGQHKREVFEFVHRTLEPGGLFLLLDRIKVDTPGLFSCYDSVWKRLERVHNANMREGESFEQHEHIVNARGDLPISLERHLEWLREAGFEVACLHLHGNRALFAGRKA